MNPNQTLRDEFPIQLALVYVNHAAVAPWPRRTAAAVTAFAQENVAHGAQHYGRWVAVEARLREQLRALINAAHSDDIALLKNTSEALSVVAHGFPWRAGDNVVIPAGEFPSNRLPWEALRARGVEVRQIAIDAIDAEQQLIDACDAHTRLISVSSVQYARGLRLDLRRLGDFTRARDIAFCVDAIQGLGVVPHDVAAMNIDFLMADAHKWMLGPEGIAVFYCAPAWRERLTLYQHGWHMVQDRTDFERLDWRPADSAVRFECGSPNMLGAHAFSASLSLVAEIGVTQLERLVLARSEALFAAIEATPNLELLTPTSRGRYAGICTFRHRTRSNDAIFRQLQEHNIICAQRGGGIRLSPHCYNDIDRLRDTIDLLRE